MSERTTRFSRRDFLKIAGAGLASLSCATVSRFLGPKTATATPTGVPTGTLTPSPFPTASSTASSTPQELDGIAGSEIMGLGPVIPDSVWPGGINSDPEFSRNEAGIVSDIYNGASRRVRTDWMRHKLAAARTYAESVFGLSGQIDAGTLAEKNLGSPQRIGVRRTTFDTTTSTYFEASGSEGGNPLLFQIFEVNVPPSYKYNQIAVKDEDPGRAYVNNGAGLKNGEVLYVVKVFQGTGAVDENLANILTFRGACGNIGKEGKPLEQPTQGPTQPARSTPTQAKEGETSTPQASETAVPGDTPTPFETSTIPPRPTVVSETPVPSQVPTTEVPPTLTPVPTQTPQPTATPVPTNHDIIPTGTQGPIPTDVRRTPTQIP